MPSYPTARSGTHSKLRRGGQSPALPTGWKLRVLVRPVHGRRERDTRCASESRLILDQSGDKVCERIVSVIRRRPIGKDASQRCSLLGGTLRPRRYNGNLPKEPIHVGGRQLLMDLSGFRRARVGLNGFHLRTSKQILGVSDLGRWGERHELAFTRENSLLTLLQDG